MVKDATCLAGDVVFLNRSPSTDKYFLQVVFVYNHDDHTVKINPLRLLFKLRRNLTFRSRRVLYAKTIQIQIATQESNSK